MTEIKKKSIKKTQHHQHTKHHQTKQQNKPRPPQKTENEKQNKTKQQNKNKTKETRLLTKAKTPDCLPLPLLRTHPRLNVRLHPIRPKAGAAKVDQLDPAVAAPHALHEHVLGLQIAVHHPEPVQKPKRRQQLPRHGRRRRGPPQRPPRPRPTRSVLATRAATADGAAAGLADLTAARSRAATRAASCAASRAASRAVHGCGACWRRRRRRLTARGGRGRRGRRQLRGLAARGGGRRPLDGQVAAPREARLLRGWGRARARVGVRARSRVRVRVRPG